MKVTTKTTATKIIIIAITSTATAEESKKTTAAKSIPQKDIELERCQFIISDRVDFDF
jgi:hypothetical protein